MDNAQAHVALVGRDIGRWLVCWHTCCEQSAGPQLGTTVRSGHREGTRGTQLGQQSKLLLQRIQHACDGSGLAILKCLQAVSASRFTRHGSDVGALRASCHSGYHLASLCFAYLTGAKHLPAEATDLRKPMNTSRQGLVPLGAGRLFFWPWNLLGLGALIDVKQIVCPFVVISFLRRFW